MSTTRSGLSGAAAGTSSGAAGPVGVGSRVTVGAGATLKRGIVAFVGETEVLTTGIGSTRLLLVLLIALFIIW